MGDGEESLYGEEYGETPGCHGGFLEAELNCLTAGYPAAAMVDLFTGVGGGIGTVIAEAMSAVSA